MTHQPALGFRPNPQGNQDLVIEIEISRSVLDRMEIYAALGVPEVWRCDARTLTVEVLTDDGYVETDCSPTFPKIPLVGIVDHLALRSQIGETSIVRAFRAWVANCVK